MIRNRSDYRRYLEADRVSLGSPNGLRARLSDEIWRFQRSLRRFEYHLNTGSVMKVFVQIAWKAQARRLGFTIPPNVFGPGLSIAHYGSIVISSAARVGDNCRLHVGVNIGTKAGVASNAPTIGSNCYIGPGAKLFGSITIGNGTVVGANAVVTKDFRAGNCTLGGIPARIISDRNSDGLLIQGAAADG